MSEKPVSREAAKRASEKINSWIQNTLDGARDKADAHHRDHLRKIGKLKKDGIDEK